MGVIEPRLRQVEPPVHKRIAFATDVGDEHALLTVGNLPHRPAVLWGHTDRMGSLLGKSAAITDHDPIRLP